MTPAEDEDWGAEADRAYEKDREERAMDGRPKWGDSCGPCRGWGTQETEDGSITCPECGGDGLNKAARDRMGTVTAKDLQKLTGIE